MSTLPDKELLRPDEVATFFEVSKSLVYQWVSLGELAAEKYGGVIRIPRDGVLLFRENHKMKPLE